MVSPRAGRGVLRRGFSLIELLVVLVIIGLLASIALPAYQDTQQRAYNTVAMADLNSAIFAIEAYVTQNGSLPDEDQLMEETGFTLSPGVSFDKYDVKDADQPDAHVHIHIMHEASRHYYHVEYPTDPTLEKRWRK